MSHPDDTLTILRIKVFLSFLSRSSLRDNCSSITNERVSAPLEASTKPAKMTHSTRPLAGDTLESCSLTATFKVHVPKDVVAHSLPWEHWQTQHIILTPVEQEPERKPYS